MFEVRRVALGPGTLTGLWADPCMRGRLRWTRGSGRCGSLRACGARWVLFGLDARFRARQNSGGSVSAPDESGLLPSLIRRSRDAR
jgi:hypothetical protein